MSLEDAFGPLSESEIAAQARNNALKSVQSSLWRHLKSAGYPRSGKVSWVLVRLADPTGPKFGPAHSAVSRRPEREIQILLGCARACHASRKADDAWREISSAIVRELLALASPAAAPLALVGSAAPRAAAGFTAAENARFARAKELLATGMSEEEVIATLDGEAAE